MDRDARGLELPPPTRYRYSIVPLRDLSRREVLQRLGAAGLVLGSAAALGRKVWDQGHPGLAINTDGALTRDFRVHDDGPGGPAARALLPQIAVARNDPDRAALVRKAVEALGGMKRFISRGDIVVVKPNIGWDRKPEQAATTNPMVVATLVKLCLEAGAAKVKVFDRTCNDPRRCYVQSGIEAAARSAGADVSFVDERRFRRVQKPDGGFHVDQHVVSRHDITDEHQAHATAFSAPLTQRGGPVLLEDLHRDSEAHVSAPSGAERTAGRRCDMPAQARDTLLHRRFARY